MKNEGSSSPLKTCIGALLLGGTATGAGMLALPLVTASGGLIPAWGMYFLCWIFSIATGFLFVELCLWLPQNANLSSMATHFLGKWGKMVVWALYIFLFYSLIIAYVAGGGHLVSIFLGDHCPAWLGTIFFLFFFSLFVYFGTQIAGKINAILMGGLIISYLLFIAWGSLHVDPIGIQLWGWKGALLGLPVIFTSFSYQGTIPSVFEYLDRDPKKIKVAIVSGTTIPFVAYIVWDFIIKGIVPVEGQQGLLAAAAMGVTAVEPLRHFIQSPAIYGIGNFFAFFALTTSFIGVSLGLIDFLSDGLKIAKTGKNKLYLCVLIYVPAFIITMTNPTIFLKALGLGGGFGCVLLLGFLPALMIWVGRYKERYPASTRQLPGGRAALGILFAFILFEITISVFSQL
jgi:tyrosine-specific transport protein